MRKEFLSLLKVLTSNITVLLIGVVLTFVIPFVLNPTNYGYWALYSLYISYAGMVILGYCDGIYLRYGGQDYQVLDKQLFFQYFVALFLYLIILFGLWVLGTFLICPSGYRFYVIICVGVGGVLTCLNSYFLLMNQATGRFAIYAKGNVIEKVVIFIISLCCLLLPNVNCFYIIFAALIGKAITLIYFCFLSKDIFQNHCSLNSKIWNEIKENIRCGLALTISGVSSMLIVGFGKFIIDGNLGVEQLGYYSLLFSITSLFTQLIYAVSIVLYPLMRKVNYEKAKHLTYILNQLFIRFSGLILLLYYPARLILEFLFPKYHMAMPCLLFLFPIVMCQLRINIVYNNFCKVMRKEKELLKAVFISLLFCVLITILLFLKFQTIQTIAFATFLSFAFWVSYNAYLFKKKGYLKDSIFHQDMIVMILFILLNTYMGFSIWTFIIIMIFVLLLLLQKRRENTKLVKELIQYCRKEV